VIEEVANEAVGVALIHCEGIFRAWTEDARSKCLCEVSYVSLVSRGEINKSCEVRGNGVERSNVIKAKLAKCRLKDFNPRRRVRSFGGNRIWCSISGGGVYGFDDFIYLRGD